MYKKQVRLLKQGYMINDDKNEAENEKQITQIRYNQTQAQTQTQIQYSETLNRGHLRVLKYLSAIERWPLLGDNFKKTVTFGTNCFVRYSRHVRYLEVIYKMCLSLMMATCIKQRLSNI